ncbi:MAG: DNA primase [Gemmatimonadaceae bacterium]|nr:DNA primase [Gemmatimonadaceae bacterium]
MIPDEVIEQVRESADIVQIIGEYVNLKRTGTDYRGPCPFHQGTHRNFSVSPKKKMFYCFVCKEAGDVFTFLQKRLGMEWPAAVRLVGEKSGIEVREVETRREGPDPREPFWEVNASAAEYFQKFLWNDPLASSARDYLAKRDIPRELSEEVGIGFAPREIGLMRTYLNTLGFDDNRLVESGMLVVPEEGSEPRPRFRGRLIFPIFDAMGRTVGFGGRILGQGEPKYLNSAEGPVFSKGKLLYGLNWAKNEIRREDRVFVVEGYFDAVRLRAAGVNCVVAPLGTALTTDQAALLTRLTKNVYLLYDSDRAGLKATFRSGDELLAQGMSVRVVTLPEGEDPDTFVRANGAAGLESAANSSIDVFERKIQLLERAGWFAELQKKRRALDRLLPTLRVTSDEIMRDLYLARTSEVTGVAKEVLTREMGPRRRGARTETEERSLTPPPPLAPRVRRSERGTSRQEAGASAERELIRAMLPPDTARIEVIAEQVGPESFRDGHYRAIYEALIAVGDSGNLETIAASLEPDEIETMEELAADKASQLSSAADTEKAVMNSGRAIADSIAGLRARDISDRMAELDRIIPVASDSEKDQLMMEKEKLREEKQQLGQAGTHSFKAFRLGRRT